MFTQTIDSIKRKLEALNAQLSIHLAAEADAIENLWDRAIFLYKKKDHMPLDGCCEEVCH